MKIRELVIKYFDTLETIFLIAFATGMVMIVKEMIYAKYVLAAASGSFVLLYWFKATERNETETTKEKLSRKLVWYSLMLMPLAVFNKLKMNDNADAFLLFTLSLMALALIIRIVQKITKNVEFKISEIIRLAMALIIALSIYALPLPKI